MDNASDSSIININTATVDDFMNLSGIGEYVPKSQETSFYERVAAKEQENALQQYMRDNDPNYTQNTQLGQFRYE